jgi:hypothetical protein
VRDERCDPSQHVTLQRFHAIGAAVGQRRIGAFFRAVLFFARKRTISGPLIFRPIDPGLAIFAFADVYLQNLDTNRLDFGSVKLKQT